MNEWRMSCNWMNEWMNDEWVVIEWMMLGLSEWTHEW